MKAIFVNAEDQTVTETEINGWEEIAPAIGADLFATVDISPTETVFVDDEGLLKNPSHFIMFEGYPQPLAGNGLILGLNRDNGEEVSTKLTVEEVKAQVTFLSKLDIIQGF